MPSFYFVICVDIIYAECVFDVDLERIWIKVKINQNHVDTNPVHVQFISTEDWLLNTLSIW